MFYLIKLLWKNLSEINTYFFSYTLSEILFRIFMYYLLKLICTMVFITNGCRWGFCIATSQLLGRHLLKIKCSAHLLSTVAIESIVFMFDPQFPSLCSFNLCECKCQIWNRHSLVIKNGYEKLVRHFTVSSQGFMLL